MCLSLNKVVFKETDNKQNHAESVVTGNGQVQSLTWKKTKPNFGKKPIWNSAYSVVLQYELRTGKIPKLLRMPYHFENPLERAVAQGVKSKLLKITKFRARF